MHHAAPSVCSWRYATSKFSVSLVYITVYVEKIVHMEMSICFTVYSNYRYIFKSWSSSFNNINIINQSSSALSLHGGYFKNYHIDVYPMLPPMLHYTNDITKLLIVNKGFLTISDPKLEEGKKWILLKLYCRKLQKKSFKIWKYVVPFRIYRFFLNPLQYFKKSKKNWTVLKYRIPKLLKYQKKIEIIQILTAVI